MSLSLAFLLVLPATLTEGYEEPYTENICRLPTPRLTVVQSPRDPVTVHANWEPKIKPVKQYELTGTDCITTLKRSGDLPNVPVTTDGYARTVPTKPVELRPGMQRVVCTNEGSKGHCLEVWVNEEGLAISITEGGHPVGAGRVVDQSKIIGQVDKAQL